MSDKQTDNSFFKQKIKLRKLVIELIQGDVFLLDCYAGTGKLWSQIKHQSKKINYIGIEKEKRKNKSLSVMEGDNLKYLKNLDLSLFNLIDLDAYGIPFEQIETIMNSNFSGYIVVTYIWKAQGRLHNSMLEKLGYNQNMIEKCPTLFSRDHKKKIKLILSHYGVKKISLIEKNNKLYFFYKKD